MTKTIKAALDSGLYAEVYNLIAQWGIWSRGGCPKGYTHQSKSNSILVIDDDTALELDKSIMRLKQQNHRLYKILFRFFVQDLDCDDIVELMAKDKTKKLTDFGTMSIRYDRDVVCLLVKMAVYKVWNELAKE